MNLGLKRLGVHAGVRQYYALHATLDIKHSATWNREVLAPLVTAATGRRLWLKGHGTGTLEAGRLEASALAAAFPGAPLVGWKGALGHTLGSCGLVELALATISLRTGRAPGTVGTTGTTFGDHVATAPFDLAAFDTVLCASNAFGGAHAAFLLAHA